MANKKLLTNNEKPKKKSLWYNITHVKSLNEQEYFKLVRAVSIFVAAAFAVSVAVYIIIAYVGGIGKVFETIAHANLYLFALAFVAVFAGYMLRFGKWSYFLKKLKIKVPFKKSLVTHLSMYSMDITPGSYGRVVAAYTLSRIANVKTLSVVPIVIVEIFTDFMGWAILALAAAVYFHTYIFYVLIIDILLLLPFLFILNKWFFNKFRVILDKSKYLKKFSMYGEEYYASQTKLNSPDVYVVSIAFTVPAAFLTALALYFSIIAIGSTAHVAGSVFIFSSSQIFGMITAIPGNIGVTDAALVTLTSSIFHISVTLSSAATIMSRIATLWFGLAVGGVAFIYTLRYWKPNKKKRRKKRK
jgi:glycosyltransferase 2 family protein